MAQHLSYSSAARRGAGLIALVAAITLALRLYLRATQTDGVLDALSYMSQYFTILTNTLTFCVMLWISLGNRISAQIVHATCIAIVIVGIVYHALLAHLVSLEGLDLWADHGTHTFVPILSGLWWVFFAPKAANTVTDMLVWVAWPILYCIYILIRASFSGFYPYPFLNVPEIGWDGLMISVAGLLVAFIVVGWGMVALGKAFGRQ